MNGMVVTCKPAVELIAWGSVNEWTMEVCSLRQVCLLSAVMEDTEQFGTRLPKISAVYKRYARNWQVNPVLCSQQSKC